MREDLIVEAFERFTVQTGPSVRPAGATAVRATVAHRRRVRAVVAGVVGAIVIAVPVVAYVVFGPTRQETPVDPAPSVTRTLDGTVLYYDTSTGQVLSLRDGVVAAHYTLTSQSCVYPAVTVSPDAQWLAWVTPTDPVGYQGTLWISRLDGSEPRSLPDVRCALDESSWSPDSSRLAIRQVVDGRSVDRSLNLNTWQTEEWTDPDGAIRSPDGQFSVRPLESESNGTFLSFEVDASDGTAVHTIERFYDPERWATCHHALAGVSDDGAHILMRCADGSMILYDIEEKTIASVPGGPAALVVLLGGGTGLVRGMNGDRVTLFLIDMDGNVLDQREEPTSLAGAMFLRYTEVRVVTAAASPPATEVVYGDGRITAAEFMAGPIPVPAWGGSAADELCPAGQRPLIDWRSGMSGPMLGPLAYVDLDGDPGLETAAVLRCQIGEPQYGQLVAYDRDGDGNIVSLGQIAHGFIWSVTPNPAGGVDIDISDSMSCCSTPSSLEYHQVRTYGWSGDGFVQTAGPTSFTTHQAGIDLRAQVLDVVWSGFGDSGWRTATVTLQVTNAGPARSNPFVLLSGDYLADVGPQQQPLAAGTSRTVSVVVWVGTNSTNLYCEPGTPECVVTLSVVELGQIADTNPVDNTVAVAVQAN